MKLLILGLLRMCGRLWCRLQGAEVAPTALIHGFPRIKIGRGGRVILADGCTLNCATWSNPLNDGRRTVLSAAAGAIIRLERNSGISSSRVIAFSGITIGENSLIGAGCLISDSDMHEVPLQSGKPVRSVAIQVGKDVFVGAGCIILKGVTIGDGAVVGAGTVVAKDLAAGTLAVGGPLTVRRLDPTYKTSMV